MRLFSFRKLFCDFCSTFIHVNTFYPVLVCLFFFQILTLQTKMPIFPLLILFFFLPLPSTPTILYVTPTVSTLCPSHPLYSCHTLSEYVENATEYFVSNTTMIFLPGEHTLKTQANISTVTSFSMIGESEDTCKIICSGPECGGFYFEDVLDLVIRNLSFVSNSYSITAEHVDTLQLTNCMFANGSDTAIITNGSNVVLDGNTFVNNSGQSADQRKAALGGAIAAVFSNFKDKTSFGITHVPTSSTTRHK